LTDDPHDGLPGRDATMSSFIEAMQRHFIIQIHFQRASG